MTLAVFLLGCAPSIGAMHPADVLEEDEMHVGAAAGVVAPVPGHGGQGGPAAARQIASPAGFTPEVQLRRGFDGEKEAGLRLGPANLGLDARWLVTGDRDWVSIFGAGVEGMFLPALVVGDVRRFDSDGGWRAGAVAEFLYGRNWSDALRVWTGPRLWFGRFSLDGTADDASFESSGWIGYAGLTFGLAAGYRLIHVAAEITPAWVFATGEAGGDDLDLSGLALAPAFGVFVRF